MKKLFYILILLATAANAQIVNIPDANFKAALLGANLTNGIAYSHQGALIIDANGDGEIQQSEALAVETLHLDYANITNLTGIQSFTNLVGLSCQGNQIASFDVSGMANLVSLYCNSNQISSMNLSGLVSLTTLYARNNLLTSLNVNGLTSIMSLNCSYNSMTSLNVSDLTNLTNLNCASNHLTSLTMSGLSGLTVLDCSSNNLTSLNVSGSGAENLFNFTCRTNAITSLDMSGLANLQSLDCGYNQLSSLNLDGDSALLSLLCDANGLTSLDVTGLTNLQNLYCKQNHLTALNVSTLTNLTGIECSSNNLTSLNASGLTHLTSLACESNTNMTTLNVAGSTALQTIYCRYDKIAALNVSGLTNLQYLNCSNNKITSLDCTGLVNLTFLECFTNLITSLNVNSATSLTSLGCSENNLTTLNVLNLHNLQFLYCDSNHLTVLDVSGLSNLTQLTCAANLVLNTLNVQGLVNLDLLYCDNNVLTTLDLGSLSRLQTFTCSLNHLTSINLKNGSLESYLSIGNNPDLRFICCDAAQIPQIQTAITQSSLTSCVTNSYCSFTPGGNYNTITGTLTFDGNNNGCDASDDRQSNIRMDITDGTTPGATFTDTTGNYTFNTQTGDFTITPAVENPSFFNFSPATATIPFVDTNNNIVTQNFCIAANGIHPDIEVVIAPITPARPGFNALYKVVYKNKGNQPLTGNVSFAYDGAVLDFVSSDVTPTSQSSGALNYNYTNLLPFENRSFYITFHVNSPMDLPSVNIGDQLTFTAVVNPIAADANPSDNTFHYHQTIIGSFDPNGITCIEGNIVSPSEIGNYLHYIINFENTGTAQAENIVVSDVIDTTQFDVSSLQVLNSSDTVTAKLTGNSAEFVFQNINLHSGGHGNILIKVKTKNTLVAGNTVSKKANIYFDYNAPVETAPENTIFQALSNPDMAIDESISVYPNPTKGKINIDCGNTIKSVQLYDIQGRLLQTDLVNESKTTIDIPNQSNGVYFIKVISDNGTKVQKIVKD